MDLEGRVAELERKVAALEPSMNLTSGLSGVKEGLSSGWNKLRSSVGVGGSRRKSRKSRKSKKSRR